MTRYAHAARFQTQVTGFGFRARGQQRGDVNAAIRYQLLIRCQASFEIPTKVHGSEAVTCTLQGTPPQCTKKQSPSLQRGNTTVTLKRFDFLFLRYQIIQCHLHIRQFRFFLLDNFGGGFIDEGRVIQLAFDSGQV